MISKFRTMSLLIGAVAVGAGGVAPAAAQAPAGVISGEVVGPDALPVVSASVHIPGTAFRAVTGETGRFRLTGLPSGNHRVVVRYIGHEPDTVDAVVRPGVTSELTVRMQVAPVLLEGLVVQGQIRGQARALNQQRTAANIQNVIAQEQIERFPDANIADGLKRIPGVTVSQDYGEAQGVMIRGLPSGLNSVTINGERVPSNTYGSRGVNLGNILSDMVGSIEVHKALTPDMDADAIGGTVNLITRSPTGDRPVLSATAASGYNELRSSTQTDASITYAQRFGKLGVLLSGSALGSGRQEESLHYRWNGDLLEDFTLYNYQLDRERHGASGTLEYHPANGSKLHLRAMYNRFDDEQYTPKFTMQLRRGDSLTTDGVTNAPTHRSGRARHWNRRIATVSAGGEHLFSRIGVDYNLSYARGEHDQPVYFNAGWQSTGDYAIDLSNRTYPRVTPANGTDPYREAAYTLTGFSVENEQSVDRDLTGALNFSLPFNASAVAGTVRFGGKYRAKDTFRVAQESAYSPADGTTLTLDQFPMSGFGNSDFYGGRYVFGPGFDPAALSLYFEQNPQAFDEFVDREKVMDEYDANENVAATYGMVDATFGRLTMTTGVRYEHTSVAYDANEVVFDESGEFLGNNPISQGRSYGGLYPSLHLLYRAGERTNLRAAATRALARPGYSSLAPYELILREDNTIERGNPALEPYHSVNLDLMAEHYLPSLGLVSAGVFHKDLGNVIVDRQYIEQAGPYAGWEVEQPVNGSEATVWGWEASWQQQLSFLPGALSGLGVYANYSFTDSEMAVPGAERKVEIPEQIPHAANFALMYEKFGFSGSLSMNYQAGFIDDLGSSPEEDEYFGSRAQLDASASQQILPQLRVVAEVNNINDAPYEFYLGRGNRNVVPLENAIYGRWATLGLRYDF